MIRLLIAGVMVLIAGNANAISNQNLLKYCNKYADDNFELTQQNLGDSAVCIGYVEGIGALMHYQCGTTTPYKALYKRKDRAAVIQHYINKIKQRPED